ncbi:hypothetical protein B5X24_HaOG213170 [Helicoverpa armigera]|uniref:Uncharacterized protein n=1 Tax=Helicoverpa armigera TaxID=29058 RepID=A0A2W1BA10_HELAM|nr:hypothetical protein B5X24_HaOG213170 [Helicoverpa armigera]
MPSEVALGKSMQRELADSIIRMVPLDEIRILLACGAKVNEPVTQGLRPLHYAIWQRYLEATRLLVVRGCDVNARDDCGYSALHLAAEHGYTELVKLLLESGAAVDYRPDTGEEFPRTTLCDEPLRLAIRNKHYEVARLLLEHGADPNKRYFFGAEINLVSDPEYLELLLTFGANPDSRDRAGLTPLMKAARQRKGMDAVLLLISFGADCPELSKPSPLDLAILKGDVAMLQMLLAAGAQVNASSSVIGSPLHVACSDNITNRKEIVQVIMKTQFRDPDGILNHLQNVTSEEYQHIFYLLLEAAEAFDLCMIKRNNSVTAVQKETLIQCAKTPISLLAQTRIFLRRYFKTTLVDVVQDIELPKILHQYLLFNCR